MWDLSLPGYKYLGPGNPLGKGLPNNWNDLVALIHDIGYGKIIDQGGNPYLLWSDADAEAYKKFTTDDYGGVLAKKFFGLKKMAYDIGIISKFTMKGANKRGRDPFYENSVDAEGNVRRRINPFDSNGGRFNEGEWDEFMEYLDTPQMQPNIVVDRENVSMENAMSNASEQPAAPAPTAAAAQIQQAAVGGNTVSKETPVSITQPSYGLQETHTAILPWTGYISAGGLDKNTPLQLKVRMNSPYDMLDMTVVANPGDGTTQISTKAFYEYLINPSGRTMVNSITNYPAATPAGTTASERPQWLEYFAKIYDFYTVIGCEYEIIMENPIQQECWDLKEVKSRTISTVVYPSVLVPVRNGYYNTDAVCATQFDTYSSTATSTGNVMPQTKYREVRAFKNIKWHPIQSGKKQIIRGVYRPGDAKRNITNDGDVKTWTATGAAPSTLQEILTLNFWADPFWTCAEHVWGGTDVMDPSTTTLAARPAVNMEINLKYIVQFKDLKQQARYPNTLHTDQSLIQTLSHDSTASGTALQIW